MTTPEPDPAALLDAALPPLVPDGTEVTCSRCGRKWTTSPDDRLRDVTPANAIPGDGEVCAACELDLLDASLGRPPRSGRDLPLSTGAATPPPPPIGSPA